jgi:helix-turn-helix protein
MTASEELRGVNRLSSRVRLATEERDQWIRKAHAAGESLRTIAEAAGLSHTAIANILRRG